MAQDELAWLDATAQAELVRKREVMPLELVEAAIARIEHLNPQLNAVVTPMFDQAREVAQGELPEGSFCGVCGGETDHGIQDPAKFCAPL
jgi:amidase